MANSLSNLGNNFSKVIHRVKCKFGHDDKKCEACRIKYNYFNGFLKYKNFKDDLIITNVCVVTKIINTSLTKT